MFSKSLLMSKKTMIFVLFHLICIFVNDFVSCSGPTVQTTSGKIKGITITVRNQRIDQFLGIPYAEPPVGSLRFAKPKPISKPIEVSIELNSI